MTTHPAVFIHPALSVRGISCEINPCRRRSGFKYLLPLTTTPNTIDTANIQPPLPPKLGPIYHKGDNKGFVLWERRPLDFRNAETFVRFFECKVTHRKAVSITSQSKGCAAANLISIAFSATSLSENHRKKSHLPFVGAPYCHPVLTLSFYAPMEKSALRGHTIE